MGGAERQLVEVDGRRLRLTNLDKVMYPETGTTKGEVISYYAEIAPVMVPVVAGRPVTRKRWVEGVGAMDAPGQVFFEKALPDHAPDWLRRGTIQHSDGPKTYPIVDSRAALVWLAQQASLEVHVPQWRFAPDGSRGNPDRMVFDLDPGEGVTLADCAEVARLVRSILDGMGLEAYPVTSGSKGIHLYAALDGSQTSQQVSEVAHELARALEADHPDLIVSSMKKALRTGKVLIDWSQNNQNKTTIAPYSLRGRARPTVAAPRTWAELDDPDLRHLEWHEVLERVAAGDDPAAPLEASGPSSGPLATYLSMRNQGETPEPMPSSAWGAPTDGRARFVIQEHHARRLHHDLRLERDGVLKSWAVPKGVPDSSGTNHLAVQTEDHPMEYLVFEGTIPAGQYGAGSMTVWDTGTYDVEKWRDDEVIFTLSGRPGGPLGSVRLALIRTEGAGEKSNWLLHRMKEQPDPAPARGGEVPARGERSRARGGTASARDGGRAAARHGGGAAAGNGAAAKDGEAPARDGGGAAAGDAGGAAGGGGKEAAPRDGGDETVRGTARRAAARPVPRPARTSSRADAPVERVSGRPMLATLGTLGTVARGEWALEWKWDGIRVLARTEGEHVRLFSRSGRDETARYPELGGLAAALRGDAVVDGELVALDEHGRADFGRLQPRMNVTKPREIAELAATIPVRLLLFDVLEVAGTPTIDEPYERRRARLERLLRERTDLPVEVPAEIEDTPEGALEQARRLGREGVMAKRRGSVYRPGVRSDDWIKLKVTSTQEIVIGGYRRGTGTREGRIRSLLVGIPGDRGLDYVGRVGSGLREAELERLLDRLRPLRRADPPFVEVPAGDAADAVWVEPQLVGEIEFGEWTKTGVARHPRWRGLRPDKAPEDVVREAP